MNKTNWREEYAKLIQRANDMYSIMKKSGPLWNEEERGEYSTIAWEIDAIVKAHPEIKRTWNHDRYN